MVADNCRLSCQLDTLVLLTNRSAKLIRKCCKSGNYGYHFSLCGSLKDDTKPEKSVFLTTTKLRTKKGVEIFSDTFPAFPKNSLPLTWCTGEESNLQRRRF